ncbi:unnamed protein product [Macrosiphum euphorbiae]|uniref:Uncharacterized protein n=1 Tax=Macrosiphum euphorbiae TaxID=13131 RepID=A0AAV0XIC0_9HEMI|nr:unnamed protein product [Macrosiphum euphorbiae]
MQEIEDEVQNNINYEITDNRYVFDFEQVNWNNRQQTNHKSSMTKNALNQIENERENVEKDLKLLEAIKDEKSRLQNLMISVLEMRNELEEKLQGSSSL